jgi:hypothetical protein
LALKEPAAWSQKRIKKRLNSDSRLLNKALLEGHHLEMMKNINQMKWGMSKEGRDYILEN